MSAASGFWNGARMHEHQQDRRETEKRDEREAKLQTLVTSGLPPAQVQQGIRDIYGQDAPALQRHVENLFRRVAGKQPQQAQAPKRAADLAQLEAQGTTPEQRASTAAQAREDAAMRLQQLKNEGAQTRGGNARPVPYYAGAVNLDTANTMAQQGISFNDVNGNPFDLTKVPKGSVLIPVYEGGGKSYWSVATDKGRYESAGNQRLFEPAVGGPNPEAPTLGPVRVPTEKTSTTVDPFGVTSTTNSTTTPVTTPVPGAATSPAKSPAPKKASPQAKAKPSAPTTSELDASGHIPAGAGNPQLVQAANQLLDGMDIGKLQLPQRDKQAAADLASKYGWSQGTFTPKEKVLLKEAGTFINEASTNKALSVLDDPSSRARLATLIGDVSKSGTLHNLLRVATSQGASPQEMEFLRLYNQLVGTISGLGQLTRSGRITEATIGRLMQELPNPVTTQSASDAKARLQRLKNEIAVAGDSSSKGAAPKSAPAKDPLGIY